MLDNCTYQALECCISQGIPFAAWAAPGQSQAQFCAAPSLSESTPSRGFFICEFAKPYSQCHWIPMELTAEQVVERYGESKSAEASGTVLTEQSTDKARYVKACSELIRRLNERGKAKTVLSTLQIETIRDMSAAEMFANLMETMPGCMRFCYYHPATGYWMGATPELLLTADERNNAFRTMALAGTLPVETWDEKNLHEHQVVVDFIRNSLDALKVKVEQMPTKSLKYGNIFHLCTEFKGKLEGTKAEQILDVLSPTPALCGYPRETALMDIEELEENPRECYGGYIGWADNGKLDAYVNIRSVKFVQSQYLMHVGGGIMPDSNPESEWNEVMLKRQAILAALRNKSK